MQWNKFFRFFTQYRFLIFFDFIVIFVFIFAEIIIISVFSDSLLNIPFLEFFIKNINSNHTNLLTIESIILLGIFLIGILIIALLHGKMKLNSRLDSLPDKELSCKLIKSKQLFSVYPNFNLFPNLPNIIAFHKLKTYPAIEISATDITEFANAFEKHLNSNKKESTGSINTHLINHNYSQAISIMLKDFKPNLTTLKALMDNFFLQVSNAQAKNYYLPPQYFAFFNAQLILLTFSYLFEKETNAALRENIRNSTLFFLQNQSPQISLHLLTTLAFSFISTMKDISKDREKIAAASFLTVFYKIYSNKFNLNFYKNGCIMPSKEQLILLFNQTISEIHPTLIEDMAAIRYYLKNSEYFPGFFNACLRQGWGNASASRIIEKSNIIK
jgi:hypothetical protein